MCSPGCIQQTHSSKTLFESGGAPVQSRGASQQTHSSKTAFRLGVRLFKVGAAAKTLLHIVSSYVYTST